MSIFITGGEGYLGTSARALYPMAGYTRKTQFIEDFSRIEGTVIHFAGYSNVSESVKNPYRYISNNVLQLKTFLRNNSIERMIFISTAGVGMYGNRFDAKESDASWGTCTNPYGQSKWLGERVAEAMVPSVCVLRLANVVGVNAEGTVNVVHRHFAQDNPITVYGEKPMREFVRIETVMESIRLAIQLGTEGIYNIGSGVETDLRNLAEWYGAERDVPVKVTPLRTGDTIYHVTTDCSAAKAAGLLTT